MTISLKQIRDLIFEIDNSPDIMGYQFPGGGSCWLMIRYEIYTHLVNRNVLKLESNSIVKVNQNYSKLKSKVISKFNKIKYWISFYINRPASLISKVDCLNYAVPYGVFFSQGNYKSKSTGFLDECNNISVANIYLIKEGKYIRNYGRNSRYIDYIFRNRNLFEKDRKIVEEILLEFEKHLSGYLGNYVDELSLKNFIKNLEFYYRQIRGSQKALDKLIDFTKPKLFLIEDLFYGGWHATALLQACKRHKVKTAEMQHGVFDIAYEYGQDLLKAGVLDRYTPDFLFTFGEYFSKFSKTASVPIEIGYYFLDQMSKLTEVSSHSSSIKKILFVAQRNYTNCILPIVSTCLRRLEFEFKLIIRLHPADNDRGVYSELSRDFNIEYSIDENLYDLIADSDYIIGLHSAVLFESYYFGKNIFIYDNEISRNIIPNDIGKWFSNEDELLQLFIEQKGVISREKIYFKENVLSNFREFWAKYIDEESKITAESSHAYAH